MIEKVTDTFESNYQKLNTGQKEAVDTIEGPVMVIAGPGTGKTQILSLRIANIVKKTDTKANQILALTFTESGVKAMRDRLRDFMGVEAYQVPIFTFHGFANELIGSYPDSYDKIIGGRPITDLQKFSLIENILDGGEYSALRPAGDKRYYVRSIVSQIAKLKQENVSPDQLKLMVDKQRAKLEQMDKIHEKGAHKGKVKGDYLQAEKYLKRNEELLLLYRSYLSYLETERLYDYEDMILETIKALQNNPDMLLSLQEQYLYLLADEHQDVNQSQNRLLELLASYHQSPNIFVVGDEKQAIYRFQGASLENFLYFTDLYPEAKIINLTTNYRSAQKILDLASDFIKSEDPDLAKLRVPLKAHEVAKTFSCQITKAEFPNLVLEEAYLVEEIKALVVSGSKPEEIAVIVRTNKEVEQIATLLHKAGVPVKATAESNILEKPVVRAVLDLLRAVTEINNETALMQILHAPYLNISGTDLGLFLRGRDFSFPLRKEIQDREKLELIGLQNPEAFLSVAKLLEDIPALSLHSTPVEALEALLVESGLLAFLLEHDLFNSSSDVRRLYDEVALLTRSGEVTKLSDLTQYFATLSEYNLSLNAPTLSTSDLAVNVLTAHKAKGLEFTVVFLPHQTDNVWGSKSRTETFALPLTERFVPTEEMLIDDERRLFYVALTRAKAQVHFSFSNTTESGRPTSPSRHLISLDPTLIIEEQVEDFVDNFKPLSTITISKKELVNAEFLRGVLDKRGWSATSFNNYLESPWEYIYKNVLRVPTIKTPELQFGSAIHGSLERLTWRIKAGEEVGLNTVKRILEEALRKNNVTKEEYQQQLKRGLEALVGYLPQLEQTLIEEVKTEYSVKALLATGLPEFPQVILTGNFDRVDLASGRIVRVLDYKTGKPKTRGVIEGKTKDSNGNYKRQLVFYALLLSLNENLWSEDCEMVLSFVEPDKKGVMHEESFYVTKEEIEDLKQELIKATVAVVSGEILTLPCDPDKCHFCHLVSPESWQ